MDAFSHCNDEDLECKALDSGCFGNASACPQKLSECFARVDSKCVSTGTSWFAVCVTHYPTCSLGRSYPAVMTMLVRRGSCTVQSSCSSWYNSISVIVSNNSIGTTMQKAGFLFLEEAFSQDKAKFRRRVVLAVSQSACSSISPENIFTTWKLDSKECVVWAYSASKSVFISCMCSK